MRSISSTVQAKLDARATTLCTCWRVKRRDGVVMGFTDHDRDIAFSGVVHRAQSGLSPTEIDSGLGFGPGGGEVAGALRGDALTESDLSNGLYDGASVETWLVDWSAPEDRVLLDIATIGEVRRGETAFSAELRSSAHIFDQQRGGFFQRDCMADLGDARCGVNLDAPDFATTGTIASVAEGAIVADLAAAFDAGFFAGGTLRFTSGANAGARATIAAHSQDGARASFTCWSAPAQAPKPGDALKLVAGCDKSASTCQRKFGNIVNFRGFPHMPGNDRVISYPGPLAPTMDGGSFFR